MCVICVKSPKHKKPSYKTLQDMAWANPDLCGVSYWVQGRNYVETWRGLTLEEILTVHDSIPDDPTCIAVYHFRIATSGTVDVPNSHPFPVGGNKNKRHVKSNASLAHNGVIGSGSKKFSDTFHLVGMLEKLPPKDQITLLEWLCDYTNKIACLYPGHANLYGRFIETTDEYNNTKYLVSNEYYKTWYKKSYQTESEWKSYYESDWGDCEICSTPLIGSVEANRGYCYNCAKKWNDLVENVAKTARASKNKKDDLWVTESDTLTQKRYNPETKKYETVRVIPLSKKSISSTTSAGTSITLGGSQFDKNASTE